jgi:hypothetical protein
VTKETLSELDRSKIVNIPNLRHDINFDPDLHFRPNLDGETFCAAVRCFEIQITVSHSCATEVCVELMLEEVAFVLFETHTRCQYFGSQLTCCLPHQSSHGQLLNVSMSQICAAVVAIVNVVVIERIV